MGHSELFDGLLLDLVSNPTKLGLQVNHLLAKGPRRLLELPQSIRLGLQMMLQALD